jgi:N4-(beta-N-acetylglucosaminyl)-L-asparaginase
VAPRCSAREIPSARASTPARPLAGAKPRVISTWDFGIPANQAAWTVLATGGHALDAVEKGVQVPESDLRNHSVGKGGYPDRDGIVTLDASIMDEAGNCGGVAAIERIAHPISVARAVMENPARAAGRRRGHPVRARTGLHRRNLLTPKPNSLARMAQDRPLRTARQQRSARLRQAARRRRHDTIGMLALDAAGRLCGACTTSGMAWKLHGRVGDSLIIGAGLYVDGEIGAATSTGVGEEVIRNAGSFLVVD